MTDDIAETLEEAGYEGVEIAGEQRHGDRRKVTLWHDIDDDE